MKFNCKIMAMILLSVTFWIASFAASAFGQEAAQPEAKPLVLVSSLEQASIVQTLAGDFVELRFLVPVGHNDRILNCHVRDCVAARLYFREARRHCATEVFWRDRLLNEGGKLRVVGIDGRRVSTAPAARREASRLTASQIAEGLCQLLPERQAQIEENFAGLLRRFAGEDAFTNLAQAVARHD